MEDNALEALVDGCWWDVERIESSDGLYHVLPIGSRQAKPATTHAVRPRSRKATASDCIQLKDQTDVCVFAVHPQFSSEGLAWYDARIVGVDKVVHQPLCKCRFFIQFYTVQLDAASPRILSEAAPVKVALNKIRILQTGQIVCKFNTFTLSDSHPNFGCQREDKSRNSQDFDRPAGTENPESHKHSEEHDTIEGSASDKDFACYLESVIGSGSDSDSFEIEPRPVRRARQRQKTSGVSEGVPENKRRRFNRPRRTPVSTSGADSPLSRDDVEASPKARRSLASCLELNKSRTSMKELMEIFLGDSTDGVSIEENMDIEQGYVVSLLPYWKRKVMSDSDDDADNVKEPELEKTWEECRLAFGKSMEKQTATKEAFRAFEGMCEEHDHELEMDEHVGLVCSVCGFISVRVEKMWGEPTPNSYKVWKQQQTQDEEEADEDEQQEGIETRRFIAKKRFSLYHHQQVAVSFLKRNIMDEGGGCILAHFPGTGKTFTCIVFYELFKQANPRCRLLLVGPKAMLIPWQREFERWNVEVPVFILSNARDNATLVEWYRQSGVLAISYQMFANGKDKFRKYLLDAPDLLVLDEGHYLRTKNTRINKALNQVKTKLRILLSGTLFQNNFVELFNLFYIVRPDFIRKIEGFKELSLAEDDDEKTDDEEEDDNTDEEEEEVGKQKQKKKKQKEKKKQKKKMKMLPSNQEARALKLFLRQIGDKFGKSQDEEEEQARGKLLQLTQSFTNYYKGDLLKTLAPRHDYCIGFELSQVQADLVKQAHTLLSNTVELEMAWTYIGIHPYLLTKLGSRPRFKLERLMDGLKHLRTDEAAGPKLQFILTLLRHCSTLTSEKVLVFSDKLQPFELLVEMMDQSLGWTLEKQILMIRGSHSIAQRQATLDRFNDSTDESRVCLASIRACSEGITLVGASRVVFLHTVWNAAQMEQAASRAHRMGQKRQVFIYRLYAKIAGEVWKNRRCDLKQSISSSIFENIASNSSSRCRAEILSEDLLLAKIEESGCDFEVKDHRQNDPTSYTYT